MVRYSTRKSSRGVDPTTTTLICHGVVPVTHVMTGVSLIYCIAKCLADLTTSAVISGPASLDKSAKREPPCGNMRIMVDSIGVCYNIRFECQRVVKRMIIRSHPQTTCMSGLGLHHTIWPILPCSRHVFPFGFFLSAKLAERSSESSGHVVSLPYSYVLPVLGSSLKSLR